MEESKTNSPSRSHTCVVVANRGPIDYKPEYTPDGYVDNLSTYPSRDIKVRGVICRCTGTIHMSKALLQQHLRRKAHKTWLDAQKVDMIAFKIMEDERKQAYIDAGKSRQLITRLERQRGDLENNNAELSTKVEDLEDSIEVMKRDEVEQKKKMDNVIKTRGSLALVKEAKKRLQEQNTKLQEQNTKLQEQNTKLREQTIEYEEMAKKIMKNSGYEFE